MKLAKCPNCQVPQSLRKMVFLTNFSSRVCSSCGGKYQTDSVKVIPATFLIIIPLLFGEHLPIFGSFPLLSFVWAGFGAMLLFKYMPLKEVHN
ncbi:TPA: hypothetical protein NJ084_004707 [Vibrio parahaemolyticus]|nr:hypothetical protein [Vibrio parahaemolyticus]EGQ8893167.1 hypothetical protein [Vibrio parahaemolyticus]EGQ8967228.1 hypothetical protein [Vibrio parahaemolyticus]EGR2854953.1 hypothetical protein [Vibrio parahaemolyticus]EGR3169452.1 hypothetical protein [Vibrio parahaemolyticus]